MKTSTLCSPCGYKDLHPTAMTCKPAASWRPPSCGDLETSILRRPGDLHSAATWRHPFCRDLETSILPRPGDLHHATTYRPPSCALLTAAWILTPCGDRNTPHAAACDDLETSRLQRPVISVSSDDLAGNHHLEATLSVAICHLRRPRYFSFQRSLDLHLAATWISPLPPPSTPAAFLCGYLDTLPCGDLHTSHCGDLDTLPLRRPGYTLPLRRPGYTLPLRRTGIG